MSDDLILSNTPIHQDAAGRFCLNDLHKAAGGEKKHQPANFLRSDEAQRLAAELDTEKSIPQNRGVKPIQSVSGALATGGGTYVVKELVYAYAMWISPRFHLQVIRAFDALVSAAAPAARPPRTGPEARPAAPYAPGANVRRLREQLNLSQRQLANLCFPALAPTTIVRLEQNDGYQMETLERVAVALGTTIEVLLAPPAVFAAKTLEGVSPLDLVDLDRLQQLMCVSAWLARRYLMDYGATAAWLEGFEGASHD